MKDEVLCSKCGKPCSATDEVESWWLEAEDNGDAIHVVCLPDEQKVQVIDQIMAINLMEMTEESTKYVN